MSDQDIKLNQDGNVNSILKELSDIKMNLAVNSSETQNIKDNVNEVKSVVKEMQKNYITQEQHKEVINIVSDHETRTRDLETFKNNSLGRNTVLSAGVSIVVSVLLILISNFISK